jgi:GMP synthase-like glutamine amidotransferase
MSLFAFVPPAQADRRVERGPGSALAPDVLVIALDEHPGRGLSLDALLRTGVRPVVVHARCASDLPDPTPFRAAIIVGSDRFDDAGATGEVGAQVDWLHRADRSGVPVMAVGLGARLLTVAFGGRVMPAEIPIIGWTMVDTQVPHLIPTGPWLTWQRDLIWLPSHAEVLAHNRIGPQVFRIGRHIGVQFHPEATRRTAAAWTEPSDASVDHSTQLDLIHRDHEAASSSIRRLYATFLNTI